MRVRMLASISVLAGGFVLGIMLPGVAMLIRAVLFGGPVLTGATLILSTLVFCALILSAFILPTLVFTRVVRLYQSRFPWVPFILGELLTTIMKGLAFVRALFLRLVTAPFMGCPFLFSGGSPVDASRTVETSPVMLVYEAAINIGVVDIRTHMPARAVVEKMAAVPMAAPETGSEITKPVVNSSIESNVWTPKARVPQVTSSTPAPPSGRP
jgi:hypothetical protein